MKGRGASTHFYIDFAITDMNSSHGLNLGSFTV